MSLPGVDPQARVGFMFVDQEVVAVDQLVDLQVPGRHLEAAPFVDVGREVAWCMDRAVVLKGRVT